MIISPGTRVGVYEVGELLGEGGMGAVYRAHDSQLGRDVAIKVIRQDLASDPERVARFGREARLLASLSHPHIATIHGVEHADGVQLLVLELVPGVSLDERLREGPLPVPEALVFAQQIAAGIEAAHDRGIIHRDLKPPNIKITPAGSVKILDFGLAKALAVDSGTDAAASAATLTSGGTAEGVILGTAVYMSPEQARGRAVDKRTDIWAFGCVLYDMLAGRTAFGGQTASDTIAAILTREPDWSLLPPDTPPVILRLLRRCLQKDVSRRLRDIGDARLEIEEALASRGHEPVVSTAGVDGTAAPARRRVALMLVAALGLGAALTGAGLWALRPADPVRPEIRFTVSLPGDETLALDFPAIAVSPLDTHVAYVASHGGQQQLFVRAMAAIEAQAVAGTEGAISPFFSPDGQWIAFFASGSLKKVPVAGGAVRTIAEAQIGFGGAWAPDNTIIFAPNNASELWRVSADGGAAEAITSLDASKGEFSHRWPEVLPDGKSVLFAVGTEGSWDDAIIAVQTIGGKDRRNVVQGGTAPRFSPTGHLLYARGGIIHAMPFDPKGGKPTGEPIAGLAQVVQSSDGAAQMTISHGGTLVYIAGIAEGGAQTLVWVDREGNVQPLAAAPSAYTAPRLSPDGRTLAVEIGGDVWIYDISANRLERFTFQGGSAPIWSPDGGRVVFSASRDGSPDLFLKSVDGTGVEERLTRTPRMDVAAAWGTDGSIVFVESDTTGRDITLLSADRAARSLLATSSSESAPALSPDGRSIAYVSDVSGQREVYLAPVSDPTRATPVSSEGGSEPVWRRDGGELYFRSGTSMMAAAVRSRPALAVLPARQLFTGSFDSGAASRPAYDVSRDGTRFLMVRSAQVEGPGKELRIVLGWKLRP
ncbi:MAG: LpqB family beta-propeller domain-containing protein [Vicinamibacterales bacterium]